MKRSPRAVELLCGVLTLWLLAGCGERLSLSPLPEDGVILAFGDSLTAGVGAKSGSAYPDALQALTGRRVVNAGVSGETTAGGVARLPSVLEAVGPDLVMLMEGGNDILRSKSSQVTVTKNPRFFEQ